MGDKTQVATALAPQPQSLVAVAPETLGMTVTKVRLSWRQNCPQNASHCYRNLVALGFATFRAGESFGF
jgi:hypothetical protein